MKPHFRWRKKFLVPTWIKTLDSTARSLVTRQIHWHIHYVSKTQEITWADRICNTLLSHKKLSVYVHGYVTSDGDYDWHLLGCLAVWIRVHHHGNHSYVNRVRKFWLFRFCRSSQYTSHTHGRWSINHSNAGGRQPLVKNWALYFRAAGDRWKQNSTVALMFYSLRPTAYSCILSFPQTEGNYLTR